MIRALIAFLHPAPPPLPYRVVTLTDSGEPCFVAARPTLRAANAALAAIVEKYCDRGFVVTERALMYAEVTKYLPHLDIYVHLTLTIATPSEQLFKPPYLN